MSDRVRYRSDARRLLADARRLIRLRKKIRAQAKAAQAKAMRGGSILSSSGVLGLADQIVSRAGG